MKAALCNTHHSLSVNNANGTKSHSLSSLIVVANPILMDNHQAELASAMSELNYLAVAILNDRQSDKMGGKVGKRKEGGNSLRHFQSLILMLLRLLRAIIELLSGFKLLLSGSSIRPRGSCNEIVTNSDSKTHKEADESSLSTSSSPPSPSSSSEKVSTSSHSRQKKNLADAKENPSFHHNSLTTKLLEVAGFGMRGKSSTSDDGLSAMLSRGVSVCRLYQAPFNCETDPGGEDPGGEEGAESTASRSRPEFICWTYTEGVGERRKRVVRKRRKIELPSCGQESTEHISTL